MSTAVSPVSSPCHSQLPHFLSVDTPSPDSSCNGIVTQPHGEGLAPLTQHAAGHVCGSCMQPSHTRGKHGVRSTGSGPSDCLLLYTKGAVDTSRVVFLRTCTCPSLRRRQGWNLAPYGDLSFKDMQAAVSPCCSPIDGV